MFGLFKKLGKTVASGTLGGLTIKGLTLLYVVVIAPMLSKDVLSYLKLPVVKLVLLVVIAAVAMVDMVAGLLLGLAFVVTMLRLSKFEAKDEVVTALTKVVDVPQYILNDLLDNTQVLLKKGVQNLSGKTGPAEPVINKITGVVDKVVDEAQTVVNLAIDSLQELTGFDSTSVGSPM